MTRRPQRIGYRTLSGLYQDGPPLHGDGARDTGHVRTDKLRQTFAQDPGLYDRTRPGYPNALFMDLAGLAEIGPASRVAEIGPGQVRPPPRSSPAARTS